MELWVEKYRPKVLEDVVIDKETLSIFHSFIERKSVPHLLFCGSAGLGKTTCAKILAKAVTEINDILYINASDETSIEVIRGKVKTFCATSSFGGIKIVILDEFDGMTSNAMMMLRNTMEEFSNHCRFILTCNHPEKVMDPIKSRCQTFDFSGTEKKLIAEKCLKILKEENIDFTEEKDSIKVIINKFYPDIRKIINNLQQFSMSGILKYNENKSETLESQNLLIQYIKEKDIKKIVKELLGSGVDYREYFNVIYDRTTELVGDDLDKRVQIMFLTADRMRAHSSCIDPEMNFKDLILHIVRMI